MTRGNVYVLDEFVGEVPSDAYPDGEFWELMKSLDGCTQEEFETKVTKYLRDWGGEDCLPPNTRGVGNWCYEFAWFPHEQPAMYRDWLNWTGGVFVRTLDPRYLGYGYYQIPGRWQPIGSYEPE